VWKDKKTVLFLSTHANPVLPKGETQIVLQTTKNGKVPMKLGPMRMKYQKYMYEVDSVDQLRGTYSTLTCNHKWWHCLFHFLLDTFIVNEWILH